MPVVGIVCSEDGSMQPFQHCIDRHECFEANCPALTFAIKLMRDNMKFRADANISASTITNCPRTNAMLELYEYFEPVEKGWVKSMGSIIHALIESDTDDMPDVIRERRAMAVVNTPYGPVEITGKPDEINKKYGVLIDYKTKENLPTKASLSHEFQFNIYAWLLRKGIFLDTGEECGITIVRGGMHYITRKNKNAFKKIGYPVWSDAKVENEINKRLKPNLEFRATGNLPKCDPYENYGFNWKCDCVLIQEQLLTRGIKVGETTLQREEYGGTIDGKLSISID